jgi:MFS family permease
VLFKKLEVDKEAVPTHLEEKHNPKLQPDFIKFALVVFTLYLAVNMIRPFFTTFTEQVYSTNTMTSTFLYVIPSLVTIAALPLIQKFSEKIGWSGYVAATLFMIIGLFFQGAETDIASFIVFRCLFALGAAWCLARLDAFVFQTSSNAHHDFSKISAIQNVGLLVAPVAASSVVTMRRSLSEVFIFAGLLIVLHIAVFLWTALSSKKQKEIKIHKEDNHALLK